ncbi:hypothetical protein HPB51_029297 [Rhipicephalus microplus]|uniref:Uncharacterized protein n=1 Tax=Rhipicephalus microplus TaxID=6941 RepID=A0A9J6CV44_RHIMP|nr:hypothetical protein HPB51_029297 [Rhipicephalus microplus]
MELKSKLPFCGRSKRGRPRRHRTRKQAFQNCSPISRRRNTKLIKVSVGATFPETRHDNLVSRRSSASDQFLETPVTMPISNIKASSSSESKKPQASSESDVLTGEEEVIASELPEPEALALPDEGVSGKQAVVLEYLLHPSLLVLAICEGNPLPTTGQDFERRTRTRGPPSTTTATATMTKTDVAAHISYRAEPPPGRVRPASNKGRGYPATAGDVWLRHGGAAPCFLSPSWLKGEKERPHLQMKNAWTLEAPFVFGITYPGRLGTCYDPQGCNATSRLSSSGGRRSSKARNTFGGSWLSGSSRLFLTPKLAAEAFKNIMRKENFRAA